MPLSSEEISRRFRLDLSNDPIDRIWANREWEQDTRNEERAETWKVRSRMAQQSTRITQ